MNRLQDLRCNILAIPDKRKRSDFVGRLRQYSKMVQNARIDLEKTICGQKHIAHVFFDADLSGSSNRTLKAISTARNLANKVTKDLEAITRRSTENSVANIISLAESSLNELKIQWKKLVLGRSRTYQNLVEAAKEANLEGSMRLKNMLSSIEEKAANLPLTLDQAERIKQQLSDLVKSISELGLEGEVGDFLIRAAEGSADPKELYKPAVKEFIERHDLWRLLRVRLS